jgi:hypothetical protein
MWTDSLKRKAAAMQELGLSQITGGFPGEAELARWKHETMHVTKRPDDEHGIVRVSIGGSDEHQDIAYCVFRGDILKCRRLLQQAIDALDVKCP